MAKATKKVPAAVMEDPTVGSRPVLGPCAWCVEKPAEVVITGNVPLCWDHLEYWREHATAAPNILQGAVTVEVHHLGAGLRSLCRAGRWQKAMAAEAKALKRQRERDAKKAERGTP